MWPCALLQHGAQTSTDFQQNMDENPVPELKTIGRKNIKQR